MLAVSQGLGHRLKENEPLSSSTNVTEAIAFVPHSC